MIVFQQPLTQSANLAIIAAITALILDLQHAHHVLPK